MSVSALRSVIGVFHRNTSVTIESLSVAFTSDYGHFARANNREPLNRGAESLGKSKADKAIAEAITAGLKAGGLSIGYIGIRTGALSKQSPEVIAQYEDAIIKASEAFTASLLAAEAFAPKVEKTKEEKEAAKAKVETAKAKAIQTAIDAKVRSGELFHADSAGAGVTLSQISTLALLDECATRQLDDNETEHAWALFGGQRMAAQIKSLSFELEAAKAAKAEAVALAIELEAVKVELEAAKAAKAKAAKAAKTAKTAKTAKAEAA